MPHETLEYMEYFPGVRLNLGDPFKLRNFRFANMVSHSIYIDLLDSWAFFFSSTGSLVFHDFMTDLVLSFLNSCGSVVAQNNSANFRGGSQPDLIVNGFFLEIETSLKKSFKPLISRLKRYKSFTYVIVPNSDIKSKYLNHLPVFHGRVYTLLEFSRCFKC